MTQDLQDNPVTRKIAELSKQWMVFEEKPNIPMAIWKVQQEEARMIDSFVLFEASEGGNIPSVFFYFETDFTKPETYAADLIQEFLDKIQNPISKELFKQEGIDVEQLTVGKDKTEEAWLQLMMDFFAMVTGLSQFVKPPTYFVAYIAPRKNHNLIAWTWWLEALLEKKIPAKLKLMLKDDKNTPILNDVIDHFPHQIAVLQPNIDMSNIMQEVFDEATKDKQDNPGVQIQKAMLKIGEFAEKKDIASAEQQAKKALKIAEKENWGYLTVAIYMMLAAGYLGIKDRETAIQKFEAARSTAIVYAKESAIIGNQLEVQTLLGIGGCHLGLLDYESSAAAYALAGQLSQKYQLYNLALEGWRMAGFCAHQEKDYHTAWDNYNKALENGKKMDKAAQQSSTLCFVGEGLLAICKKVGEGKKRVAIEDDFTAILGENWLEKCKISTK